MKKVVCSAVAITLLISLMAAAEDYIDFKSDKWELRQGTKVVEHLGRQALVGGATLKDVEFENGIIEYDIAFSGVRTFAGVFFRLQDPANYEYYYMRPHASGVYNALQYTPHVNGNTGWQLYALQGYTAAADIPKDTWIPVRIEVSGAQAMVYLNKSKKPSLIINDLKHSKSKGKIVLNAPANNQSWFSNFRYESKDDLNFEPQRKINYESGLIRDWEISRAFTTDQLNYMKTPAQQNLKDLDWKKIETEPSGLVNISRLRARIGREMMAPADVVYAKTVITAQEDTLKELAIGYSDNVVVFLNGKPVYRGKNGYRQRDPKYAGVPGFHDSVFLDLKKGANELMLAVGEQFGGWGFKCLLKDATGENISESQKIKKMWELAGFSIPESVVYDKKRDRIYVSNYFNFMAPRSKKEFISSVKPDGKADNMYWIMNLNRPTGMAIFGDKLHVVERDALAVINIETAEIEKRIKFPDIEGIFPNDIVFDESGTAFITESATGKIFRMSDGKIELWLEDPVIQQPNGLNYEKGTLLVGNTTDGCVKKINVKTREKENLVCIYQALIDSISPTGDGKYIVTDWNGASYLADSKGNAEQILDTSELTLNNADSTYVQEKKLFVVPTFYGGKLLGYSLK